MAAGRRSKQARARGAPRAAASGAGRPPDPEVARLTRLLELMHAHGLVELELGPDGHSVRMSKAAAAPMAPGAATASTIPGAFPAAPAASPAAPAAASEQFLSPMVGTFYRAPSPEAKAFVSEGDTVRPDTVICIIEAMKVMNEVRAERSGRIVQILVENGEAVEYGQPLFVIARA